MIKIVQFGEGNFLRTFVDLYFDTLNKDMDTNYDNNTSNKQGAYVLDFFVIFLEFVSGAKFFANDYNDARKRVYYAVDGV